MHEALFADSALLTRRRIGAFRLTSLAKFVVRLTRADAIIELIGLGLDHVGFRYVIEGLAIARMSVIPAQVWVAILREANVMDAKRSGAVVRSANAGGDRGKELDVGLAALALGYEDGNIVNFAILEVQATVAPSLWPKPGCVRQLGVDAADIKEQLSLFVIRVRVVTDAADETPHVIVAAEFDCALVHFGRNVLECVVEARGEQEVVGQTVVL